MTDYDEDFFYYDEDYEDKDEWADDPCSHCGPWCEHWGGDGLCMIAIEEHARRYDEYYSKYVHDSQPCPSCGKELTLFEIPTDELWTWPGGFYDPLVALTVYAMYGAPKGEIHHRDEVYHIWIGEGDLREEKLIRLTGK